VFVVPSRLSPTDATVQWSGLRRLPVNGSLMTSYLATPFKLLRTRDSTLGAACTACAQRVAIVLLDDSVMARGLSRGLRPTVRFHVYASHLTLTGCSQCFHLSGRDFNQASLYERPCSMDNVGSWIFQGGQGWLLQYQLGVGRLSPACVILAIKKIGHKHMS
jgi:hypothetical protein